MGLTVHLGGGVCTKLACLVGDELREARAPGPPQAKGHAPRLGGAGGASSAGLVLPLVLSLSSLPEHHHTTQFDVCPKIILNEPVNSRRCTCGFGACLVLGLPGMG